MPWKVKANTWAAGRPEFKTVILVEDDDVIDDETARQIMYWIRNMEHGEKVVVRRFTSGETG
jgi:hypothetical protein